MKLNWTKGLPPEKKEAIKAAFNAGGTLRERQVTLLREKIESARKKRILESAYENPNWSYLQADFCGYERALEEVISLLE